jgi:hypothetical protein
MTVPATCEDFGIPASVWATIQGHLDGNERLIWVGQPSPRMCLREAAWLWPVLLFLCGLVGVVGWFFDPFMVAAVVILLAVLVSYFPFYVLGLRRSWYALTTKRVLVHEPSFLASKPTIRSLDAARVGEMQVDVEYSDGAGKIVWGSSRSEPGYAELVYLPQVERVAERIRQTLGTTTGDTGPVVALPAGPTADPSKARGDMQTH